MFVACFALATTLLAANQQSSFPTRDLASEASALQSVRALTGQGSVSKPSSIGFYGAKAGTIDHLQWSAYPRGATLTVTLLKAKPTHWSIARPGWMEASSVLGLPASIPKVGTHRTDLDEPNWTEAGCYVNATPYTLSVRVIPSDSARPFATDTWAGHNARALEVAEAALLALAEAGFVELPGQKKEGVLLLTAQSDDGAVMSNVRIHLTIPGQPTPLIATTDENGAAKVIVPVPRSDRDLAGSASAVTYTSQSRVGGAPLYLVMPLTLEFTTPFTLAKAKEFRGTLALRFFVRPIYVKVEHSDSSDPVEECTVTLHSGDISGPALIRVFQREDVKRNAVGQLVLRVPVTRTNGGMPASVFATTKVKEVVYEGWESVELPSNTVPSAAVIIELVQADFEKQFRPYRAKLEAALVKAGYTKDEVARIMAVKIKMGSKNNYLDGVIQLGQGSLLRTASENFLHEMGHLITDVIAPDEPEGVGITHEVNEAVNMNAAWDEGRAHFYSTILGQVLGLPGAKPTTDAPQGVNDCENRELFIQRALVEHYTQKNLYATPAEALARFREVHREGQRQLGRPPRTVVEFLQVAEALENTSETRRIDLRRIRSVYAIGT